MKSSVLYNNRGVLHKDMVAKKTGFTGLKGLRRAAAVVILSTLTLTTFQAEAKIYRRRYSMKQQELNLQAMTNGNVKTVGDYSFEPIRGQPMLHWAGKRPFTSTQFYPAQEKERHGDEVNGWMNRIYWGDNLQVMSHLLKEFRGKVNLIYIDPPFDSKADYKKTITLRGTTAQNDHSNFEDKQYTDIWTNDEYLQFMYERLILLRELLSDSGVLYLHCDWHKNHYLRCLLEEVFGPECFRNEIVWYYYNKMPDMRKPLFTRSHDTIYAYSKGGLSSAIFNLQKELRDAPVKQLVRQKINGKMVNARDENGNVMYRESTERIVDDVWRMSMLQPADKKEPLGYPTQKPEALLERIIKASSNPGDIVFDCFMGSGTTQAVAMKLGRKFIGADINLGAVQTTTKRLLHVAKELGAQLPDAKEPRYTGFTVYNVNNYDVFRNPVEARDLLVQALELQPLPKNGLYDGEKDGAFYKIMPVNRLATKADLNEIVMNFDYKLAEKRQNENPGQPVLALKLVCMGHEPDLKAALEEQLKAFKLDIEVVDILRDKSNLVFKRDSEADIVMKGKKLKIKAFYPMNLLKKLSLQKSKVGYWKELVESVMIDFNYDGAVFTPTVVDVPQGDAFVKGEYDIPADAGTIRVKITDLLSESLEAEVK